MGWANGLDASRCVRVCVCVYMCVCVMYIFVCVCVSVFVYVCVSARTRVMVPELKYFRKRAQLRKRALNPQETSLAINNMTQLVYSLRFRT